MFVHYIKKNKHKIIMELNKLNVLLQGAEHPVTILLGGDKIKEQMDAISGILSNVDNVLVGGALVAPFAKAMGYEVGNSKVCDNCVAKAKEIIAAAGAKLCLPVDCYAADKAENDSNISHVELNNVPQNYFIMDIGVKTVDIFAEKIEASKTFVWNGTLGHTEMPHFAYGTYKTALATARGTASGLKAIVDGEDTKAAIKRYGLEGGMFFVENDKAVKQAEKKVVRTNEAPKDGYTIDKYNFKGKKVLLRVDFNVPLDENFNITDDTRIVCEVPTIKKILKDGGSPIIMSHLGRPKKAENKFSLKHIVKHVSECLGVPVQFADDCQKAQAQAAALKPGEVLMLENLRFYAEEESKPRGLAEDASDEEKKAAKEAVKASQKEFVKTLASYGDCYVNDAFGTAHRAHASTYYVAKYFPNDKMLGYLVENEVNNINKVLTTGEKPVTAIVGGSKISTKIDIIKSLITKVDNLIVGGGISYTFIKAMGGNIGRSLAEDDCIPIANEILDMAKKLHVNLYLPVDCMIGDGFSNDCNIHMADVRNVPDGWEGMDMGVKTVQRYTEVIENSKTILWNGPMGVFEMEHFSNGTMKIALAVCRATELGAFTLVGGGDSIAALNKFNLSEKISYASTAGGALLEYIEGKELPGLKAISSKEI